MALHWAIFYEAYMPFSPAQHRLFEMAAHNPQVAQRVGIPQATAQKMASEGIKDKPQKLAYALRNMK